ncbi:MAG TPA: MlaD family protein [bacterium]|jgi:phospholipid/cholesterol/gamma-HCH transport system substrate-binding protein
MIKKATTHIKLGIFITIGFVLFAVAIYVVGMNQQLFNRTFHISGIFNDVSGLQAGNNVRFSGITVGIIQRIKMESDTTVRVDASINEDVRRFIKKDAVAVIGTESLMGNKVLVITPGTSNLPEIEDGDTLKTNAPMNIDQLMGTVKKTNDNLAVITGDLADIVHSIREGKGTIGQLLMDSTYLTVPIANAIGITNDVKGMVASFRQGTIGQLMMDTTRLKIPIDNAIQITSDLQQMMESIRLGHGIAGRLISDSAAALAMDTMMINIQQGTENMKFVTKKAKKSFLLWGF